MEDIEDMADTCLETIVNNDEEGFEQILQAVKLNKMQEKHSKWVEHIPVVCTMCNNRNFLEILRLQLSDLYNSKSSACFGDKISVLDIARALDYRECMEILMKLYEESRGKDEKEASIIVKDFYLFADVLNIAKLFSSHQVDFVCNVIIKYFRRLIENGIDIRARGPRNTTILHEVVSKLCTAEMISTLFSFGCDINSVDDTGCSVMSLFISKARQSKIMAYEIIWMLRLLLYQNPVTSLDSNVILNAIFYDRMKFPDDDDISDDDFSLEQTEDTGSAGIQNVGNSFESSNRKYECPNEHLRLLPWLYKYGYHISQENRDLIESPDIFRRSVTYDLALNNPHTLKRSARTVFRDAYPGQRLHVVINSIALPSSIREFILMECLNIGL